MEELDLTKILKNCPKDTKLYSTILGEVTFLHVDETSEHPIKTLAKDGSIGSFSKTGLYYGDMLDAECVLFPSKECRDWSKFKSKVKFQAGDHVIWKNNEDYKLGTFIKYNCDTQGKINVLNGNYVTNWNDCEKYLTKVDKFDLKWLKPGDGVLVRCYKEWKYAIFSHVAKRGVVANCITWYRCIPYNAETKHLVGTTDKAPEFYQLD